MQSIFRIVGAVLLIAGLSTATYYGAFYDVSISTSAYDGTRIVNMQRLSNRQSGIMLGFGFAAFGALALWMGRDAPRRRQTDDDESEN